MDRVRRKVCLCGAFLSASITDVCLTAYLPILALLNYIVYFAYVHIIPVDKITIMHPTTHPEYPYIYSYCTNLTASYGTFQHNRNYENLPNTLMVPYILTVAFFLNIIPYIIWRLIAFRGYPVIDLVRANMTKDFGIFIASNFIYGRVVAKQSGTATAYMRMKYAQVTFTYLILVVLIFKYGIEGYGRSKYLPEIAFCRYHEVGQPSDLYYKSLQVRCKMHIFGYLNHTLNFFFVIGFALTVGGLFSMFKWYKALNGWRGYREMKLLMAIYRPFSDEIKYIYDQKKVEEFIYHFVGEDGIFLILYIKELHGVADTFPIVEHLAKIAMRTTVERRDLEPNV